MTVDDMIERLTNERDQARVDADAKGMRVHEVFEEVEKYRGALQEVVEFDRQWVGDDAGWGDRVRAIIRAGLSKGLLRGGTE